MTRTNNSHRTRLDVAADDASEMLQVVGYVRVSTAGQAEGVSLDAQRARIEAVAAAKGLTVRSVHADEGISGKRADNRPGLQAALSEVCACGGVLIAYDLTRLARSVRDAVLIVDRLREAGAQIALATGDIDTTTPYGNLIYNIFAALGEFEREQIAARTKASLDHKRAAGEALGSTPWGFREREGRLVVHDEELRGLRIMHDMVFAARTEGEGVNFAAIARQLTRERILPRYRYVTVNGRRKRYPVDGALFSADDLPAWRRGVVRRIVDYYDSKRGRQVLARFEHLADVLPGWFD